MGYLVNLLYYGTHEAAVYLSCLLDISMDAGSVELTSLQYTADNIIRLGVSRLREDPPSDRDLWWVSQNLTSLK